MYMSVFLENRRVFKALEKNGLEKVMEDMCKYELTGVEVEHGEHSTHLGLQHSCHNLVPILSSHHLIDSEKGVSEVIKGLSIRFVLAIGSCQLTPIDTHS